MTPQATDKVDAATTVAVNGPADEKLHAELIDGLHTAPPSADLASAYGLRSTAPGRDETMRNVRGGD